VPKKKRKRRRLGRSDNACHRRRAEHKDHVWCWDFVFDRTESGAALKWLSIVDEFTRECLCLKVDRSITSEDVIDTLAELFAMRVCRAPAQPTTAARRCPRPGVHRPCHPAVDDATGNRDLVHRTRSPLGERLRREFPQPLPR
jgi:transposase InsO family protein